MADREWFPPAPAQWSKNGRIPSSRGRRKQASDPLGSIPGSARDRSLERYRNAIQHPDSAWSSSGQSLPYALHNASTMSQAVPETPLALQDTRYSQVQGPRGSILSVNSSPAARGPAHLHLPENRLTFTAHALTERNGVNSATSLMIEPSPARGPGRYDGAPTEMPHQMTAFTRRNHSPSSTSDDSPTHQAANDNHKEGTQARAQSSYPVDPPKAPAHEFRPSMLQIATPDIDLRLVDAIFDPSIKSKAGPRSIKSYWAGHGDVSRADFNEYRKKVEEDFKQARWMLVIAMQEMSSIKRQHANDKVEWQNELELAQIRQDRDAAARDHRAARGEIRKPKPMIEKAIEREARRVNSPGNTSFMEEGLAGTPRDAPLYDNLPDQMRQMTVELLLRRSQVAYVLKDWEAMRKYSRQAHDLARSFKWEPFAARCAFWTGIALYHQRDWIGAYENFQEADRTEGYYIPRKDILNWLTQSSERLKDSLIPWSNGLPAARGDQAPSYLTPLGTVFEEGEHLPIPITRSENPVRGHLSLSQPAPRAKGESTRPRDYSPPTGSPGPKHNAGSDRASSFFTVVADAIPTAPTGHIPPLNLHRRPVPAAITLPSIVEPPRVRTSLLYSPGVHRPPPRSGPSSTPSMNGHESHLAGGYPGPSNNTLSLEELGISSAAAPPSELSSATGRGSDARSKDDGVFSLVDRATDEVAGWSHQQPHSPDTLPPVVVPNPLDASSPSQTAEEINGRLSDHPSPLSSRSDTLAADVPIPPSPSSADSQDDDSTTPASVPPRPTATQNFPSHQGELETVAMTLSQPSPPPTSIEATPQPSQSHPSPLSSQTPSPHARQDFEIARLDHRRRLENEKIEAAIRNVKAVASSRILSAKTASSRYAQAPWEGPMSWGGPSAGENPWRSQSLRSGIDMGGIVIRERGNQNLRGADTGGIVVRERGRPRLVARASDSVVPGMGKDGRREEEGRRREKGMWDEEGETDLGDEEMDVFSVVFGGN